VNVRDDDGRSVANGLAVNVVRTEQEWKVRLHEGVTRGVGIRERREV